jgi:hypothetical protein
MNNKIQDAIDIIYASKEGSVLQDDFDKAQSLLLNLAQSVLKAEMPGEEIILDILNQELPWLENSKDKVDRVRADTIRHNNKTYAKVILDELRPYIAKLKMKIEGLEKEKYCAQDQLNEWQYQLAYLTKEDIATPKGVSDFVMGEFERAKKENAALKKELEEITNVARAASQISENQMYEIAALKKQVEELKERWRQGPGIEKDAK